MRLVGFHLGDDGTRGVIVRRQAIQVAVQMGLHLPLGLDHKAQADPIPQTPGQQAQTKAPAYQRGFRSEGRPPSACRRCWVQDR